MADRVIVVALLVIGVSQLASAQQTAVGLPDSNAPIAFVNVNLIPMDDERVETGHTVLVRGDRIISVGARAEVPIPENATVIDGRGRYLLPGLMRGPELAERLRALSPGLKVLFMSGYTDETVAAQGLVHEDAQFIQKPFTQTALLTKVLRMLGRVS